MADRIIHCKDCEFWEYPHYIEGANGEEITTGVCELAEWTCGEGGYCMYGREKKDYCYYCSCSIEDFEHCKYRSDR